MVTVSPGLKENLSPTIAVFFADSVKSTFPVARGEIIDTSFICHSVGLKHERSPMFSVAFTAPAGIQIPAAAGPDVRSVPLLFTSDDKDFLRKCNHFRFTSGATISCSPCFPTFFTNFQENRSGPGAAPIIPFYAIFHKRDRGEAELRRKFFAKLSFKKACGRRRSCGRPPPRRRPRRGPLGDRRAWG